MSDSLERRIRRLEDRQELADLVAAYGRLVDDRDWVAVEALYALDSVFDTVGGRITGRKAVREYYESRTSQFGPTFHYPHTWEVFFDGDDAARGIVTSHAELAIDGDAVWIAQRYHDKYLRTADGWRFQERKVNFLYVLPLRELPSRMAQRKRTHWPKTEAREADIERNLGI
jgi:hypothetical protein